MHVVTMRLQSTRSGADGPPAFTPASRSTLLRDTVGRGTYLGLY